MPPYVLLYSSSIVQQDGKTALHLAAIHDSDEIARLLLEKDFPIDETDEVYKCCFISLTV